MRLEVMVQIRRLLYDKKDALEEIIDVKVYPQHPNDFLDRMIIEAKKLLNHPELVERKHE